MTKSTTSSDADSHQPQALDAQLQAFAHRVVPHWELRRIDVLLTRLGWNGEEVPTLQEAGDELGLTRERVRQLQVKLKGRMLRSRRYLPRDAVRAVIEVLAEAQPADVGPIEHLVRSGLLIHPMASEGLRLAADMSGLGPQLAGALEHWEAWDDVGDQLANVARSLARSVGLVHTAWLEERFDISSTAVSERLRTDARFIALGDGWFREAKFPLGKNRLVNVAQKILAVASPLAVVEMREGLERAYRWRRIQLLPSIDGLERFFATQAGFGLTNGSVWTTSPLPRDQYLDSTERVLTDILLADPDGVMDREELRTKALARGMKVNTFSVYSSYSPVLKHVGLDLWTYRGNTPSPAVLRLYVRKRRRKSLSYEWSERGHLVVRYILPSEESTVVGFPSALRRYVADREFTLTDSSSARVGTARVDSTGMSWGYGGYTQSQGATKDDVLELDIDLSAGQMELAIIR